VTAALTGRGDKAARRASKGWVVRSEETTPRRVLPRVRPASRRSGERMVVGVDQPEGAA
jgi:hypothetical protein